MLIRAQTLRFCSCSAFLGELTGQSSSAEASFGVSGKEKKEQIQQSDLAGANANASGIVSIDQRHGNMASNEAQGLQEAC